MNGLHRSLSFALLIFMCGMLSATPELIVTTYNKPTLFNSVAAALIAKGDDIRYKEPGLDDTSWKVVALPSDWSKLYPGYNGICWYRIHFSIPNELPDHSIGITLGVIVDSDETYLNGYKIGTSGAIDGSVSAYDKVRVYELPVKYISPGKDNVLAIRVRGIFSYMNGPYTGEMKLDSLRDLYTGFILHEISGYTFVIIYLFVSLYFFLFFLKRRKDKENLLFALFCLFMGIYCLLRMQLKYVIGLPFFVAKKTEYLVLTWLVFTMTEFIVLYFRIKHNVLHIVYFIITFVYFAIIVFTNDFVFWDSFNQHVMVPTWLVGVAMSFYILIRKFKTDPDARYMFFSLLILFGTFINDVLINMNAYKFVWLTQYGFFFFIAGIAVILSNRFFRLHNEVEDLNVNLEQKVLDRTDELNKTVGALEEAKAETDNILRNVQEGIFLLDGDLRIGNNYSKTLTSIFETQSLGGASFEELIASHVSEKDLAQALDYIHLALSHPIPEPRLVRLNPLDDIPVYFHKNDRAIVKHLNFAFSRIEGMDSKRYILATVRDVTENRLLARRIKDTEARAEKETELILSIIHINPLLVTAFIREAREDLAKIGGLLESARFSGETKSLLTNVFTIVHALKGNASMLGIKPFAEKSHELEETMSELGERHPLEALDLITLPYGITALIDILKDMENLIDTITGFKEVLVSGVKGKDDFLSGSLQTLVATCSEREKKKVEIDLGGLIIPSDLQGIELSIKKILIQLVKNAIVHGIESPGARISLGKPEKGTIVLSSQVTETELAIAVRDDGSGIDIPRVKEAACGRGLYTRTELDRLSDDAIASLIFATGMTTKEYADMDSGRGIGLDVVREEILARGGNITLDFRPNEYTSFTIRIPLARKGSD